MRATLQISGWLSAFMIAASFAARVGHVETTQASRSQLFDKPDSAKLGKDKSLNQVGAFLESNPFSLAVIAANTSSKGSKEENLKLSQARAMLAQKFKVDDARIKTMGVRESGQASATVGTSRFPFILVAARTTWP